MTQRAKHAQLYRMVTDAHICPYGVKSLDLLQREGFEVDDHALRSRKETDAFKVTHGPLHYVASIHSAIAIIIRFSVSDMKPSGTLLSPPTQAHLSSRLSI